MDVSEENSCVVNGQKYIKMEDLLLHNTDIKERTGAYKKYGVILLGQVKYVPSRFWKSGYTIVKILVPEINVIEYNNNVNLGD